jgi:hypothetical protein
MTKLGSIASLMILSLFAVAADAPPKTGPITSVDPANKSFVATFPGRPLTIKWDDKTVFTLDEKPSTAEAALKADLQVTVVYAKVGEDRIASKVSVVTAAKKDEKKD